MDRLKVAKKLNEHRPKKCGKLNICVQVNAECEESKSGISLEDCEEFIDWFIEQAKAHGCETCIFLGDWHHHRSATNVSTMNYTVSNVERLAKSFKNFYFINGNHDLFYRDKREINWLQLVSNLHKY